MENGGNGGNGGGRGGVSKAGAGSGDLGQPSSRGEGWKGTSIDLDWPWFWRAGVRDGSKVCAVGLRRRFPLLPRAEMTSRCR